MARCTASSARPDGSTGAVGGSGAFRAGEAADGVFGALLPAAKCVKDEAARVGRFHEPHHFAAESGFGRLLPRGFDPRDFHPSAAAPRRGWRPATRSTSAPPR